MNLYLAILLGPAAASLLVDGAALCRPATLLYFAGCLRTAEGSPWWAVWLQLFERAATILIYLGVRMVLNTLFFGPLLCGLVWLWRWFF